MALGTHSSFRNNSRRQLALFDPLRPLGEIAKKFFCDSQCFGTVVRKASDCFCEKVFDRRVVANKFDETCICCVPGREGFSTQHQATCGSWIHFFKNVWRDHSRHEAQAIFAKTKHRAVDGGCDIAKCREAECAAIT